MESTSPSSKRGTSKSKIGSCHASPSSMINEENTLIKEKVLNLFEYDRRILICYKGNEENVVLILIDLFKQLYSLENDFKLYVAKKTNIETQLTSPITHIKNYLYNETYSKEIIAKQLPNLYSLLESV